MLAFLINFSFFPSRVDVSLEDVANFFQVEEGYFTFDSEKYTLSFFRGITFARKEFYCTAKVDELRQEVRFQRLWRSVKSIELDNKERIEQLNTEEKEIRIERKEKCRLIDKRSSASLND